MMYFPSLVYLAILAAASAAPAEQSRRCRQDPFAKAAYFLDNSPKGSSVVAMSISADGMLSDPVRTPTGGKGSITLDMDGKPVMADSLQSQYAVLVEGNMLFTVNAGSNTVAMFSIDPRCPTQLRTAGRPVSSGGEFPLSVAYSDKLNMACVLNGGKAAGVACFDVHASRGLKKRGPFLPLGAALNQTTPPTGPPSSATQIDFSPDQTSIVVTTKGDAMAQKPGYILSWAVDNSGAINATPQINVLPNLPMAFGGFFLNQTTMLISDPSFGASILDYSATGVITETVRTNLNSQKAVCWTAWEPALNAAYVIDAAQPVIYELNPQTGTVTGTISGAGTDKGYFDASILDGRMYVLTADNGVAVFDLASGKQVQFLNLTTLGDRIGYDGMATWPSY